MTKTIELKTIELSPSPMRLSDKDRLHTAEPWQVSAEDGIWVEGGPGTAATETYPSDRLVICDFAPEYEPNLHNADRITACVNFCRGFGTAWLNENSLHVVMHERTEPEV